MDTDSRLIVVAGPTGSGKTRLALALAESFNGEIVNCDSVQLYRHLDIGSAKTPPAERNGVPHHLIDVLTPDQCFTAGDYMRMARPLVRQIAARGRVPVVAGGTGFYLRALLNGLFPAPIRDPGIRGRLLGRKRPLHPLLKRLDPGAALQIHPNDRQKLVRALEICLTARRPMTELQTMPGEPLAGFAVLQFVLNPSRSELREAINQRTAKMFRDGLLEEVRSILDMGFSPESKALQSIGYREAVACLRGELTPAEAAELAAGNTRRYAKRQLTWFRRDHEAVWLPGFGWQGETLAAAAESVRRFLGTTP